MTFLPLNSKRIHDRPTSWPAPRGFITSKSSLSSAFFLDISKKYSKLFFKYKEILIPQLLLIKMNLLMRQIILILQIITHMLNSLTSTVSFQT